ncbi:alpha-amylase/4-alpha-glucanotransferase domain-containing protein [Vampirovibrio sp.]|uniref:alpha-amylase/4-alpha-glucanotransferase domain-containing protein n=1 Tax=Vampirovibrio sp. TaxID=2717857 RepID=UPI00359369CB
MGNQINLILGMHNHQPVDNWDHVIEDAYVKCYKPFLDVLENHPKVGMSLHYTGYLLDWLFERHPEIIDQLKRLIQRGQVEMISGAYYEPIIAIIPDADKQGQIEKLTDRVEALTGQRPNGLWLAERVWEPHLVKPIAQAGIQYLFLDDSHFKAAGLDESELYGRYTSEEQGKTVDIFPVDKTLRYQIPYDSPQAIVDYLGSIASADGKKAAIYFDDGEKFGVWPGSHRLVFKEKWLDHFFKALSDNSHMIKAITPSQYVARTPPLGRIYLPTASYSEMMEWSLPAKQLAIYEQAVKEVPPQYNRFFRAGFWRNFLVKYPEANNIHKKMLYVSEKIHRLEQEKGIKHEEALDELWKGQSNDIFWHGVFGGLYLTNLRTANYQHLIKAENIVDALLHGPSFLHIEQRDLDCDGQPEILIESSAQNLYLHPHEGGSLFELDYRRKNFNLLDTLARRYESYHDKLGGNGNEAQSSKEHTLNQHLHYDWHRRVSLLDHFLGEGTDLESLSQSRYPEQGDFVNSPYESRIENNTVILSRDGNVWVQDQLIPIRVEKQLILADPDQAQTIIRYRLTNLSAHKAPLWFSVQFNANLLAGDAPDRYYYLPESAPKPAQSITAAGAAVAQITESKARLRSKKLISREALKEVYGIGLRDEWLDIDYHLIWNRIGDVWRFPIETVSQSETGFEKVYQSSAMFPNWKLTLQPQESWDVEIIQRITSHQP